MAQLSSSQGKPIKKGFELNLCTKGHCLLCLKRAATTLSKSSRNDVEGSDTEEEEDIRQVEDWIRSSSLSNSLQNLCKYLRVNVAKLANKNIKMPGMAKTMGMGSLKEKAKMTNVFLCGKCEGVTESFSNLYQNLEKIQMEIDNCLEKIHESISKAEDEPDLAEAYQVSMSTDYNSMFMAGLIGEMKREISIKCLETRFSTQTSKVSLSMPRNINVRFSSEAPNQENNKKYAETKPNSSEDDIDKEIDNDEEDSDSDASLFSAITEKKRLDKKKVKLTPADAVRTSFGRQVRLSSKTQEANLTVMDNDDSHSEDNDEDEKDDKCHSDSDTSQDNFNRNESEAYPFDMKTGKFKCRLPSCPKLFNSRSSVYGHCRNKHPELILIRKREYPVKTRGRPGIKMENNLRKKYLMDKRTGKYKCADANCFVQCSSRGGAHVHYRAEHTNHRFKCLGCGLEDFRYKESLKYHQKNNCTAETKERQQHQVEDTVEAEVLNNTVTNTDTTAIPIRTEVLVEDITSVNNHPLANTNGGGGENSSEEKYKFDQKLRRFKCCVAPCRKTFKTKGAAYNHRQVKHSNVNKIRSAGQHKRRQHHQPRRNLKKYVLNGKTGKYKCLDRECPSQFSTRQYADLHYQSHHLNIRHICGICKTPFTNLHYMQKHMKTCTGAVEEEMQMEETQPPVPETDV